MVKPFNTTDVISDKPFNTTDVILTKTVKVTHQNHTEVDDLVPAAYGTIVPRKR